ncbi:MAG TPA: biotin/lipoyl-containing protein, partial [Gemmatimonadales bacterium]|nr:biotin/lipoyl-containing protein [Gemmatimonadales bacterium]
MSRIDVVMPQMGESITEGTLSRWLKKVGDPVKRDEPMFEISTDKVDAEIPAPGAGTLAEVLVQEGQTVAVQTVVARIETEAGSAAAPAASPATPPAAPPRESAPPAAAAPSVEPPRPAPAPAPAPPAAASTPPTPSLPVGNGAESAEERLRRRSTPLVRKMAAEHNLDLASIPGSGVAGRVTKHDVVGYLEGSQAARAPAAPAPSRGAEIAAPAAPARAAPATVADPWEGDKVEPWSRIRRLTAEHMVMSRRVSPHVNTIFEI